MVGHLTPFAILTYHTPTLAQSPVSCTTSLPLGTTRPKEPRPALKPTPQRRPPTANPVVVTSHRHQAPEPHRKRALVFFVASFIARMLAAAPLRAWVCVRVRARARECVCQRAFRRIHGLDPNDFTHCTDPHWPSCGKACVARHSRPVGPFSSHETSETLPLPPGLGAFRGSVGTLKDREPHRPSQGRQFLKLSLSAGATGVPDHALQQVIPNRHQFRPTDVS